MHAHTHRSDRTHLATAAAQMLKVIYDAEVVSEEAILAWADEKELAEEEEKQLVKKVCVGGGCCAVVVLLGTQKSIRLECSWLGCCPACFSPEQPAASRAPAAPRHRPRSSSSGCGRRMRSPRGRGRRRATEAGCRQIVN